MKGREQTKKAKTPKRENLKKGSTIFIVLTVPRFVLF
jgi:hypothetical protein